MTFSNSTTHSTSTCDIIVFVTPRNSIQFNSHNPRQLLHLSAHHLTSGRQAGGQRGRQTITLVISVPNRHLNIYIYLLPPFFFFFFFLLFFSHYSTCSHTFISTLTYYSFVNAVVDVYIPTYEQYLLVTHRSLIYASLWYNLL